MKCTTDPYFIFNRSSNGLSGIHLSITCLILDGNCDTRGRQFPAHIMTSSHSPTAGILSPIGPSLFLSALTSFFSNQPSHFFLNSLNQRTSRRSLVLASTPLFPLCVLVQCLSFYQKVEFYTVTHWFLFWKKRIKCLAVMGTSGNWKKALIGLKKPEKDDLVIFTFTSFFPSI